MALSVRVKQTRHREYPDALVRDLAREIAVRVGLTSGAVIVQFRAGGMGGQGSYRNEWGRHVVRIDQTWSWGQQLETLAHELRHAQQQASRRLRHGPKSSWLWEGIVWPSGCEYSSRPWELDAQAFEAEGPAAWEDFKARGLVPESATERARRDCAAMGLDTRLVCELTDEEVAALVAERRASR